MISKYILVMGSKVIDNAANFEEAKRKAIKMAQFSSIWNIVELFKEKNAMDWIEIPVQGELPETTT